MSFVDMQKDNNWFEDWLKENETLSQDKTRKNSYNHSIINKKKTIIKKRASKLTKKFHIEDNALFEQWVFDKSNEVFDKDSKVNDKKIYIPKNLSNIVIERDIDLHNCTVSEALNLLRDFIISSYHNNIQIIKIIHGKGKHSVNREAKVKNAVIDYLRKEAKAFIVSFREGPKRHGGSGATIVWLKHKT